MKKDSEKSTRSELLTGIILAILDFARWPLLIIGVIIILFKGFFAGATIFFIGLIAWGIISALK